MTTQADAPFGALLRRHRLAAGLSQEALAERARLSVTAIAALERGRRTAPRPETIALLSDALALDGAERARFVATATGLPAPEEAAAPAAPEAVPPPTYTLPIPPTPLIGREREEATVTHLLERALDGLGARLLTLLGPGGVGKTRLALAVAVNAQTAYADGVIFCDLSALRAAALVPATVAQALGLREDGAQAATGLVMSYLRDRRMLLVLDNFEQVVEAASWLADLVAVCPRLVVLVTSRVALGVRAEQRYRVPPLAVPPPGSRLEADGVTGFAAVRLFAARAAAHADFTLSAEHLPAVVEICRRLDGLPLAIELAAARVALLPPRALLARLEGRLSLLAGGARDLPARQQTLRATIEWSIELLSPAEQLLFRRVGIFAGGGALEAIDAICNADGSLDTLEGISSLLDKSLLVRQDSDSTTRFAMLETLRAYARERLAARDELEALRRAHATWFLAQLAGDREGVSGPGMAAWLARWAGEHDNVRAALTWAREHGEAEIGLELAGVFWRFWYVRGYLSEGRAWLDSLLALPGGSADARARALRGACALASQQGDLEDAARRGEECLVQYRALDDQAGMADVHNTLGTVARARGEYADALTSYEEAMRRYQGLGDRLGVAVVLNNRGMTARLQGDLARAAALFEESLALRRELGDSWGIALTLQNLGEAAYWQGDLARAAALGAESLTLRRELGERLGIAVTLLLLAAAARRRGGPAQAAAWYRESLEIGRTADDTSLVAATIEGLAGVAHDQGRARGAARLLGAAESLRRAAQSALGLMERAAHADLLSAIRQALGEDEFAAAWAEGERLSDRQLYTELLGAGGHLLDP